MAKVVPLQFLGTNFHVNTFLQLAQPFLHVAERVLNVVWEEVVCWKYAICSTCNLQVHFLKISLDILHGSVVSYSSGTKTLDV